MWAGFTVDTDITFPPVIGRFVRIEIGGNTAGYRWAIAELEVYGARRKLSSPRKWGVVVVNGSAPAPLQFAAKELSYYLTELTDEPYTIVSPAEAEKYGGLHFRLVEPPEEKLPYSEPFPVATEELTVRREGNEILFKGKTPRAVLYGVYEFLYRQGVRWVSGDAHGDYVPALRKFNLSVLPIGYRPPFAVRYANYPVQRIPRSKTEHGFLWNIRSRFNDTWAHHFSGTFGGIPPRMSLGFGYAHTLNTIVPSGVLKQHPDWVGKNHRRGWYKVPCTTNPQLSDYIVERILELDKDHPQYQGFCIHPPDVPSWCECERCLKYIGKLVKTDPEVPDDLAMAFDYSELYFKLINDVALKFKPRLPAKFILALAYANHRNPPQKIDRLPDNVCVDICQYWVYNLPTDSPKNAGMKQLIEGWSKKCKHLGVWDYVLIHGGRQW